MATLPRVGRAEGTPHYDVDQEGRSPDTSSLRGVGRVFLMEEQVDRPPVVRCPGCQQPMEAKERTSITDPSCGYTLRVSNERHGDQADRQRRRLMQGLDA